MLYTTKFYTANIGIIFISANLWQSQPSENQMTSTSPFGDLAEGRFVIALVVNCLRAPFEPSYLSFRSHHPLALKHVFYLEQTSSFDRPRSRNHVPGAAKLTRLERQPNIGTCILHQSVSGEFRVEKNLSVMARLAAVGISSLSSSS